MSQQFGKKFGLGVQTTSIKSDVKAPIALDDIPNADAILDPEKCDEEQLAALEQLHPKMAAWVRTLDYPKGALGNRDAQSVLGEFFAEGVTPEQFKKLREEDRCPFCHMVGCPTTQFARSLGWRGGV